MLCRQFYIRNDTINIKNFELHDAQKNEIHSLQYRSNIMQIPVDIQIDFLWGDKHFVKNDWGPITYIVGANGTGKSIFAEKLKEQLKVNKFKVRYFGADRISNLAGKWDNSGFLAGDRIQKGLDIGNFKYYQTKADELGQSIDALIELQNKLDLQIKIESILSDLFQKELTFEEKGGFLNIALTDKESGNTYDLKKNESHGLKEIITLLTFIYDDDYNCIILDEPELNLHPQFQQFILQEIKKNAGSPDDGKKIFIILTHSPYMLDISNSDDLLNYIVFHKGAKPSFITEYSFDHYQLQRLNRLLLRINTNHKTLFFASSPVFVEGYIDQQLLNLIECKRDIPLGAEGISIIDVGGKDEVDIMYSLCRTLGINAKAIVDLDALFEGKIRQTVSAFPTSSQYLAEHSLKDLMATIGELQNLTSEIADALIKINPAALDNPSLEFVDFLSIMKSVSGDNTLKARRRLTLLALQRMPDEVSKHIDSTYNIKLTRARSLATNIIDCFEASNVFILSKGEIENYYTTYTENQYSISDNKKTDYFLTEYDAINSLPQEQLVAQYPDLITLLDKLCPVTTIDTNRMVSLKLSDWIHVVQSLFRANNIITLEAIEVHPKAQWNKYKRVIDIVEFSSNAKENTFICKFKLKPQLAKNSTEVYEFTQSTVPSQFSV